MNDEIKARFDEISLPNGFPSRILDEYEPLSCLKYSESRRVYLFREKSSEKKVVVKCSEAKNGELLKMEYDILRAADPQTAQFFPAVLDYFCEGDVHYYVRDYIVGLTLDELVQIRGVLSPKEACAAVAEICGMVNRLHCVKPPIVCRDIKPENLIACSDGKYRMIGLDTSRHIKKDSQHGANQPGTEESASPEQQGYRRYGKRTDVYVLGMLLLFLSSGDYDKNAELPKKIKKIVTRCTEYYPCRRYASAAALQRALLGHSAAATAGFAGSFAVLGAAVVLAVSSFLPKPVADLTDGALINTAADTTEPVVSEELFQFSA